MPHMCGALTYRQSNLNIKQFSVIKYLGHKAQFFNSIFVTYGDSGICFELNTKVLTGVIGRPFSSINNLLFHLISGRYTRSVQTICECDEIQKVKILLKFN